MARRLGCDRQHYQRVLLFATKAAGNKEITNALDKKLDAFEVSLFEVMKELALMMDLVPQLKKIAQGREISGLASYE